MERQEYECCEKHERTKFHGCPECHIDELEQELSNLKATLKIKEKRVQVTEAQIEEINNKLDTISKLIKNND